jgi:hypothetical protein
VLAGTAPVTFREAAEALDLPRGRVDLRALAAGFGPSEPGSWGADRPVWRLRGWGAARALAPVASAVHVAWWVADDERDGDGDPSRDSNGRILLRAEAFGPVNGHRAVLVLLSRVVSAPAALTVLDWREP